MMDYDEVKQTIETFREAIENGEYKVTTCEPDNVARCKAPDGRTFYMIIDRDDAKSSNDLGSCTVEIAGYEITYDFGMQEFDSSFFDEIEDEYILEDGNRVDGDDLIGEAIEALDADGIYFGDYTDLDGEMEICSKIWGLEDPEYYYYEDSECPYDVGEDGRYFHYPKDLGYGEVCFDGHSYYLTEKPSKTDGEKLKAVATDSIPSDQGLYDAVSLTLEYDETGEAKVIACETCDKEYDGKEGH